MMIIDLNKIIVHSFNGWSLNKDNNQLTNWHTQWNIQSDVIVVVSIQIDEDSENDEDEHDYEMVGQACKLFAFHFKYHIMFTFNWPHEAFNQNLRVI